MLAGRWTPDQPRDKHNAEHHDRYRDSYRATRALVPDQPRDAGDEEYLEVAEHGRHACTDRADGVRPQYEINGQEPASHRGPRALCERSRAALALFDRCEHDKYGECESAAVERGGDRTRAALAGEGDKHRGPGDRRRAETGHQQWPPGRHGNGTGIGGAVVVGKDRSLVRCCHDPQHTRTVLGDRRPPAPLPWTVSCRESLCMDEDLKSRGDVFATPRHYRYP